MTSTNTYITESHRENFQPTYLYIKQHSVTGLKYFGKTIQDDPIKYLGSGPYWKSHINKHGKDYVETLWTKLFNDVDELVYFALMFSKENAIVESANWANKIIEDGLNGYTSEQSKQIQKTLLDEKTHHFLTKEHSERVSRQNKNLAELGVHNFQSEENKKRMSDLNNYKLSLGIHIFQSEEHKIKISKISSERSVKAISDGTHIFLDPEFRKLSIEITTKNSRERVNIGTHNFQTKEHKQRVSSSNTIKSKRSIYIEVRDLYRSLNIPIPSGLNLKSDEFLVIKKEELLRNIFSSI